MERNMCERECKMLKLELYTRRRTHTHPLSHIFTLSLSLTHTQRECKTTHGPGEASPFCVFFMYLGPSVLNVVSRLSTSTLRAISDTGGRSLLILCWGQGIQFLSSIFFHRTVCFSATVTIQLKVTPIACMLEVSFQMH